jgi:hypothetical protein
MAVTRQTQKAQDDTAAQGKTKRKRDEEYDAEEGMGDDEAEWPSKTARAGPPNHFYGRLQWRPDEKQTKLTSDSNLRTHFLVEHVPMMLRRFSFSTKLLRCNVLRTYLMASLSPIDEMPQRSSKPCLTNIRHGSSMLLFSLDWTSRAKLAQ